MRTSFNPFNFSIENTPNFVESLKNRDVSVHFFIFLIDKNLKTLRVFSYDPEFSYCCQKTTQNTPIHCATTTAHENCSDLENFRVYCVAFSYSFDFFKDTFGYVFFLPEAL